MASTTTQREPEDAIEIGVLSSSFKPQFRFGVSHTALWVGYQRILEANEENPLFQDPLAKILMDKEAAKEAWTRMAECVDDNCAMRREPYLALEQSFFALRHRFLDDFILTTCGDLSRKKRPPLRYQVVDVASGFDSRAFRLPFLANTTFFELDRKEVLDYKHKRIAGHDPPCRPTCDRWMCVPVDLVSDNWEKQLIDKGFDTAIPSVWIMEGLSMYVPYKSLHKLLARIRAISAPDSSLAADMLNNGFKNNPLMRRRAKILKADGSPFVTFIDYPVQVAKSCGYSKATYHFMGDPHANYDRVGTCSFLRLMVFIIRLITNLVGALGVAMLVLSLPWYVVIPIVIFISSTQEAIILAGAVDWLSRQLKMFFWPSPYLLVAKV